MFNCRACGPAFPEVLYNYFFTFSDLKAFYVFVSVDQMISLKHCRLRRRVGQVRYLSISSKLHFIYFPF